MKIIELIVYNILYQQLLKECRWLPNSNICTKLNTANDMCCGDMKETLKNRWKRDPTGQLIKIKYIF